MQKSYFDRASNDCASGSNSSHESLDGLWTRIHSDTPPQWPPSKHDETKSPPSTKKLVDYTKSPGERGRRYDSRDVSAERGLLTTGVINSQNEALSSSRRTLFRSRTAEDFDSLSTRLESYASDSTDDKVDFFLKVPTNRRRISDPTLDKGRIHENQVIQELRDSFHRRKSSLRKRMNQCTLTPSKSKNDSPSLTVDGLDADDLARLQALSQLEIGDSISDRYANTRESADPLERSGRSQGSQGSGRRRQRSSIIKRSIASLARNETRSQSP